MSQDTARVIVANVKPVDMDFKESTTKEIDETGAYLFRVNNDLSDVKDRSFIADSQIVQTSIIVFNASNWEHISSGSSEVILPEEELYILVYAEYHTGEIFIAFDYEGEYDPYEHYWTGGTEAMPFDFWSFLVPLLCIGAAILITKRKR